MSLSQAYEQNPEAIINKITNSILNREIQTKTILKDDFHAYLFNKVKNNFSYAGITIQISEENIIKQKIVNEWPKLKEKNIEWYEYHQDTHYKFLRDANKEDIFMFLNSLLISKVLFLYINASIRRGQIHVLDYGFKNNYINLDSLNFNTAIDRSNMEAINYFIDKGFNIKLDENSHLKTAIISKDEEIQKFLIDSGCTTQKLSVTQGLDCSWILSYENSKKLQEKLSENLEEKENKKQTKI